MVFGAALLFPFKIIYLFFKFVIGKGLLGIGLKLTSRRLLLSGMFGLIFALIILSSAIQESWITGNPEVFLVSLGSLVATTDVKIIDLVNEARVEGMGVFIIIKLIGELYLITFIMRMWALLARNTAFNESSPFFSVYVFYVIPIMAALHVAYVALVPQVAFSIPFQGLFWELPKYLFTEVDLTSWRQNLIAFMEWK